MTSACAQLERECASWLGVRGAVATGFGRGALWLALEGVDVNGGEVAVPELICSQVVDAVRRAAARPVFYPIRRDLSVDAQQFEAVLTPRTRAAIIVHYWGRALSGAASLAEICRQRGVFCLEDCALALGAAAAGRRAGTFGSAAVFSFTKSDWCYGGGMVCCDSETFLRRLRLLGQQHLRRHARLALSYGLLRRADFAANRPRWSARAEWAGRFLQAVALPDVDDFYEAGRMDAALPGFAARRALAILRGLSRTAVRRREIVTSLRANLQGWEERFLWPDPEAQETAAFLPLLVSGDRPGASAMDWMREAARDGVTLRLAWPAYQTAEPGQDRDALAWWAEHLAILEIHPRLCAQEIERTARTLSRLAKSVC